MSDKRLGDDLRDALHRYAARAVWPAGFQIYESGRSADGLFVVVGGLVVLRSPVRGSRGFVPWVASPGETFGGEGFSSHPVYATDARTFSETETLFVSSANLRALTREQPGHALALFGQVMTERTRLIERLRELTSLSVEQRLLLSLARLGALGEFAGSDGRIELDQATHRLLCEMIGATRESVTLVLSRLAGAGVVERQASSTFINPEQAEAQIGTPPLDSVLLTQLTAPAPKRTTIQ